MDGNGATDGAELDIIELVPNPNELCSSVHWDGDGTCAVPCDLIISAEYGKWGGDIDKTQLPAHFYVDHVRIYEKAGE